jgi:hypothetical protein
MYDKTKYLRIFLLSFTNETNNHYQGWQNICVYTELITTSDMESNNVLSKKKYLFFIYIRYFPKSVFL